MKITAIYFTEDLPKDPLIGSATVYIEVGGAEARLADFDDTYVFRVCTPRFVAEEIALRGFFPAKHLLVVPRLESDVVCKAIETLLPQLSEFAQKQ